MSIRPLVEPTKEHRPDGPSQAEKRVRAAPATMVSEALAIHTLTSVEPPWPQLEAMGDVDQGSLKQEWLERIV